MASMTSVFVASVVLLVAVALVANFTKVRTAHEGFWSHDDVKVVVVQTQVYNFFCHRT